MRGGPRRVVLKLSGEAFGPDEGFGISLQRFDRIAAHVSTVARQGTQIALVVGGGNLVRGRSLSLSGVNPVSADLMGMLATVMNGLALADSFERAGVDARLLSAVEMNTISETYVPQRCIKHLEKGRVAILVGGTGNPYFTTDTAAALRAREVGAQRLLKATNVDGVYSGDPETDPSAQLLPSVGYTEYLSRELHVMDATAIAMCREAHIPVVVFNYATPGNLERALRGEEVGTRIGD